MMELLTLCWEFLQIGLFAVGGGMATIPFLMQLAQKYPHWFTLEMLMDMIAVSESTPGPIGVNMATYVGFTVEGIPGAVLATFSLTLMPFLILLLIARALQAYRSNLYVDAVFSGLRPAVTGLIAAAGYLVLQIALFHDGLLDWRALILFVALFACTRIKKLEKLHPIAYIAFAAAAGCVFAL